MAWLLLGVKPCISTAVVMSLVVGFQLNLAVPVGISANWIAGKLCPPVDGLGGDEDPVALESAPSATKSTAHCKMPLTQLVLTVSAGSARCLPLRVHSGTRVARPQRLGGAEALRFPEATRGQCWSWRDAYFDQRKRL